MTVRFIKRIVKCFEFGFYINEIENDVVCEVDLTLDVGVDEIEDIFSNSFIVSSKETNYVFSDYKLYEYYKEGDYTKIILIKNKKI